MLIELAIINKAILVILYPWTELSGADDVRLWLGRLKAKPT